MNSEFEQRTITFAICIFSQTFTSNIEAEGGTLGIPGILPPLQRRSGAQVREATGGSLGDNSDKSDHDEIEGEILEITEDMDPAEAKRVKR